MNSKKELLRVRITLTAGILALIAILALVFLKFPDNTDARFVYETNKDGKLVILGYTGDVKKLTIPSEIDGVKVSEIGERAFGSISSSLRKVIISEGIEKISAFAFYSCPDLESVSLPSTLKYIEEGAFGQCKYLTKITLPSSLEYIGPSAFEGCMMLPSVKVPSSVTEIGADAFLGCESLVLDVSENPLAAEMAESYGIPTSFEDSGNYYMLLAVGFAVFGILIFVAALIIGNKIIRSKKSRNAEISDSKDKNE